MRSSYFSRLFLLAVAGFVMATAVIACGEKTAVETSPVDISGTWRAALESQGEEVPFIIKIFDGTGAIVINGDRGRPDARVKVTGNHVEFSFSRFIDSTIKGEVSKDGTVITGEWDPPYSEDPETRIAFRAESGVYDRFPASQLEPADFSGTWAVTVSGSNGEYLLQGEFLQQGDIVTGAFLTKEGFYASRFLEGRVDGNEMRLSTFDGARAHLFIARMKEDGTIEGEMWGEESIHPVTWTATRWTADVGDPYLELTHLTSKDGRFPFSFPDIDGNIVSHDDERFEGKALIISVIGPRFLNSPDVETLLTELYGNYRGRGLEIVSLATVYGHDFEDKARHVRRHAEIYGITWPILIFGGEGNEEPPEPLLDVDKTMASYPSTFFVGRDGIVKAVHAGFSGPDTGEHYDKLVEEFRANIEEILATPGQ